MKLWIRLVRDSAASDDGGTWERAEGVPLVDVRGKITWALATPVPKGFHVTDATEYAPTERRAGGTGE